MSHKTSTTNIFPSLTCSIHLRTGFLFLFTTLSSSRLRQRLSLPFQSATISSYLTHINECSWHQKSSQNPSHTHTYFLKRVYAMSIMRNSKRHRSALKSLIFSLHVSSTTIYPLFTAAHFLTIHMHQTATVVLNHCQENKQPSAFRAKPNSAPHSSRLAGRLHA